MDTVYKVTSILRNLAVILVATVGASYLHDARENGRELKVIVVEQRKLFDRLRGDFDGFRAKSESERQGLLARLQLLERKRGEDGDAN